MGPAGPGIVQDAHWMASYPEEDEAGNAVLLLQRAETCQGAAASANWGLWARKGTILVNRRGQQGITLGRWLVQFWGPKLPAGSLGAISTAHKTEKSNSTADTRCQAKNEGLASKCWTPSSIVWD